jgi:hypothetical protein
MTPARSGSASHGFAAQCLGVRHGAADLELANFLINLRAGWSYFTVWVPDSEQTTEWILGS